MKVIHENILVALPADENQGGVYIPEEDRESKRVGKVVEFGEAVPESVQEILKSEPTIEHKEYYDGSEITIRGNKYLVMNYKDILIIL